jgi:hypothetical protein
MWLYSTNELLKYKIQGKDRILGDVRGFLFDTITWRVKYWRGERGFWPFKKELVVPSDRIDKMPNKADKIISTNLLEAEIENLSSTNWFCVQLGKAFENVNPYWRIGNFPRTFAWRLPFAIGSVYSYHQEEPDIPQVEHTIHPQLRSLREFKGYQVDAKDGEIGEVKDLIIDADGWKIRYVIVDSPPKRIMMPSQWINQINPSLEILKLNLNRKLILDSPYVIG